MRFPKRVRLVEVGPRDGLQNEPGIVPVAARIALIDGLAAAGLTRIEAGSFVAPHRIPQMAGTAEVLGGIRRRPGVCFSVLTPNRRGAVDALAAGADEFAIFTAASETFCQRNINCSIAESLDRFAEVFEVARQGGRPVRGYVSCVLGCPYEGEIAPAAVADVAARLLALGCCEISLGDTIGTGTPGKARALIEAVAGAVPVEKLAAHFHDTYGQALANLLAVLDLGIAVLDSAVAGLGGCPYARGASGNVATEDVLYMLDGLGVATGVDLDGVAAAGAGICAVLGREPASKVARALAARDRN